VGCLFPANGRKPQEQNKHVESLCFPCLHAGSNPASSTILKPALAGFFFSSHCTSSLVSRGVGKKNTTTKEEVFKIG
jgi:hypothetical protein